MFVSQPSLRAREVDLLGHGSAAIARVTACAGT